MRRVTRGCATDGFPEDLSTKNFEVAKAREEGEPLILRKGQVI